VFTEPDTWNGGAIELLFALDPGRHSVEACLRAIWSWPNLQGPYTRFDVEPASQAIASAVDRLGRYAVAELPGSRDKVAFKVTPVDDEDGHWIYAGVPLGSLGRIFPVRGFPFGSSVVEPWEETVHDWLFDLALHIHGHVPFDRAVIGWLTAMEVEELATRRLPTVRYHSYLVASQSGLVRHAPNRTSAILE
jgi:hypothetical protein